MARCVSKGRVCLFDDFMAVYVAVGCSGTEFQALGGINIGKIFDIPDGDETLRVQFFCRMRTMTSVPPAIYCAPSRVAIKLTASSIVPGLW